jgi:hypothetical protein
VISIHGLFLRESLQLPSISTVLKVALALLPVVEEGEFREYSLSLVVRLSMFMLVARMDLMEEELQVQAAVLPMRLILAVARPIFASAGKPTTIALLWLAAAVVPEDRVVPLKPVVVVGIQEDLAASAIQRKSVGMER